MFSMQHLTTFIAVAEELHFGRAAARLQMTQPPLSRQVQMLEKELRVQLFDRSSRSVRLTQAGKSFLIDARRIVNQAQRATLAVRKASLGEAGIIRIGFTAASAYSGLDAVLGLARRVMPEVQLDLHELVTRDQIEFLSEGSLDLGLARPTVHQQDLATRHFFREPLMLAAPADHPLARNDDPVDIGELQGTDMIMYSPVESRYFHDVLSSIFRDAAVSPNFVQQLSQIHSILALINLGWGVALVPASARRMRFEGIVYRPLALDNSPEVELDLLWRVSSENPALMRLLDNLAEDAGVTVAEAT